MVKKRRRSCSTDSEYCSESDEDDELLGHNSSVHAALEDELLGRVKYDDASVFERLRIYDEDDAVIERCHERYQVKQARDLHRLLEIGRESEIPPRNVGESDAEKVERRRIETSVEERMHDPLHRVLTFLTNLDGHDGPRRRFVDSGKSPLSTPSATAEAYLPSLPDDHPDFYLLNDGRQTHPWDSRVGFAMIRGDADEGSPPVDGSATVKSAVLQCADYAHVHLACHPFSLFSVALLITGTDFRVVIVDHAGVLLSPLHSIVDDNRGGTAGQPDARTFVRVVRALAHLLGERELGRGPSVTPVSRQELAECVRGSSIPDELSRKILAQDDTCYPSYLVPLHGPETDVVHSGSPDLGLRGADRASDDGDLHVLKSSWRDPRRRPSEADVYRLVGGFEDCPPGVAGLMSGGDVLYEDGSTLRKLSTAKVRGDPEDEDPRVLHRILLRAFYAIVEVHEYLCEKGILHGDISPGNLLLWTGPSAKAFGFLSDFDRAYVNNNARGHLDRENSAKLRQKAVGAGSDAIATLPAVHAHMRPTETKPRGVAITGTLHFMALELLKTRSLLKHTVAHDLESIGYVLGYSVLRRLLTVPGCPKSLRTQYREVFGAMSIKDIILQRKDRQPLSWAMEMGD
ncbi:uncharacterized protein B0H18DRAFT_1214928 [Fomitopsis serialis]|uniref:uncharacterized protein n=1 Tax=Fomitopsis serialis TaxID=139415 RepID=UPI002007BE77|nr:uncharacterized protein B0H18DRAFT_1214928 [Neoantrodia serialis]KAH9916782.1 hypothetical protein B0H18DRAFT_1214928 [Neoantrodia serialis]